MCKVQGITFLHFGQLRGYNEGNPEVIEVNKRGLCVRFNAWHSKRIVHERQLPVVITESSFEKKGKQAVLRYSFNSTSHLHTIRGHVR